MDISCARKVHSCLTAFISFANATASIDPYRKPVLCMSCVCAWQMDADLILAFSELQNSILQFYTFAFQATTTTVKSSWMLHMSMGFAKCVHPLSTHLLVSTLNQYFEDPHWE